MYRVEWDDYEGYRHEAAFNSLEDAQLEAEALARKYDYVKISLSFP